MPVSRMVVFPERSFVSPFSDQLVDATCQKPCELLFKQYQSRSLCAIRHSLEHTYLSTGVYVIGLGVTEVSMNPEWQF